MVNQIKCLVNEQGKLLEILQEIRAAKKDERIVNLSNFYDVLNEGRYDNAVYDFTLKEWVGVGEQRPIVIPTPSEIEKLKMEQAKANTEMINLMMSMLGGAM